jgi:glucose-6-phosphate-specific signal transduction histidine kinase
MSKIALAVACFVLSVGTIIAAFLVSVTAFASAMRSLTSALFLVPVALLMWYLSWRTWKGLYPYMFGGTK